MALLISLSEAENNPPLMPPDDRYPLLEICLYAQGLSQMLI